MSKGSGRRRITPSDGLRFDEETGMTNIEKRGGAHYQSGAKEVAIGLRTGAQPTTKGHYGSGKRWGGNGRKDDNRNWKNHGRGKQYEHNAVAREKMEHHTPISESLAARLRERSIATLLYEARQRSTARRSHERRWNESFASSYAPFRYCAVAEQKYLTGFALFEKKVREILDKIRYNLIDEFGRPTY